MADWLEPGKKAPDFTLPADDGTKVKLSACVKPVVLYFYPATTRRAGRDCVRDGSEIAGTATFGSAPAVESHVKFRDKFS